MKIAILGSTGAVGKSALDVARHLKSEVVALAAKSNIDLLEAQAREFHVKQLAVFDETAARALQKRLPGACVLAGMEGLKAVASAGDFILLAMVGGQGLIPALEAVRAGKRLGIANKEILVAAGEMITNLAKKTGAELLPVDSEHSALFQCLKGEKKEAVRRLILTASGGPFRTRDHFQNISLQEVLFHPHYRMGPKVAVHSSTLLSKGLEMIEARWLFDIAPEKIEAIVHPEQRIHSFVEFIDGSMLAQMSEPDMRLPIQYAITYPTRLAGTLAPYDFVKNGQLHFFQPDIKRFICLDLAIQAMHGGKSYPCFLSAAAEVLADRFLRGEIGWADMGHLLEKLISSHSPQDLLTLEAILEMDQQAREKASRV